MVRVRSIVLIAMLAMAHNWTWTPASEEVVRDKGLRRRM